MEIRGVKAVNAELTHKQGYLAYLKNLKDGLDDPKGVYLAHKKSYQTAIANAQISLSRLEEEVEKVDMLIEQTRKDIAELELEHKLASNPQLRKAYSLLSKPQSP